MLFDVLAAHLSFDGETRGNLRCYGPLPSMSVSFYLYLFLFSHFKIRLLYMKNVMLRATRTFIEDLCAPEYAHNHLAVEISHPDGFTDTQELSIRVYSSEYRLLALHFCGKQTALCSHFSLQELLEGSLQWKVLQEKMDTRKVVLVEVPYKEYSRQESNLLDLLGNLMEQKTSSGTIFIFYGTMDSTYQLRRCSTAMSRIFTEENTIYTPDKSENDNPDKDFPANDLPLPFDEEQPLPHDEEDSPLPEDNTPSDAEQALQEMVGLTRLKEDLREARMLAAFMKRRMELGLDTELDNRHHMLFLGNPGTGKTTVAKLIGQLYHQMGLLSSGHTIETCRTKLVGEYIGETEKHIRQAIEEARGGVLFIDEAYTLITETTAPRDEYFGNGRWLHNLIEQGIIKCMAQRIMSQPSIPDNTFLFRTITQEDVVKAGNRLRGKQVVKLEPQPIRRIGFRA